MVAPQPISREIDYLDLDRKSERRLELISGKVVAMSGASRSHNHVTLNTAFLLRTLALSQRCTVTMETVRLRIDEENSFYPDLMVACDENLDSHTENAPCLIVEVLSPSTSWVDHGRKRLVYLQLESLRHYLLIDIENRLIEHLHRSSETEPWSREIVTETGVIELTCPTGHLTAADIFEPDPRIGPIRG
jgi:Uma2 family endonuclease